MQIANPIYDVYFKYLLEDNEIARELIGAIIDEEVLELSLRPQEQTVQMKHFAFTVLRMDFHAVIQTGDGQKSILIEMQKGKYFQDLQRFRKYLGERYSKDTLPIITIYFLGYPFDKKLPAVTFVKRSYYDRFTNQKLLVKNSFIEGLTHDSYVVQTSLLKQSMRSKLESILSIFDQNLKSSIDYILSYPDSKPDSEILQKIIRRLKMAGASEELRQQAEIEDEVEKSFKSMARKIQEKEEMILNHQKILAEKEQLIAQNQKALKEKEQAMQMQEQLIAELKKRLQE